MKKVFISIYFLIITTVISYAQNVNKMLGDNYFNHLAYVKAIKHYEKALKKDSSNVHILKHLAASYKHTGDFNKAEELYGLLHIQKDTSCMQDYARLLIYNNKYHLADSVLTQFKLSLPNYNKQLIDSLMSAQPDYKVSHAGINTKYSEFRPCFSGNKLIFTSSRDTSKNEYEWNGQPYLSLFTANMTIDGKLCNVRSFSGLDSRYHISSFQHVRNRSTAIFTMNNANAFSINKNADNEVNLGIYMSKRNNGEWQKPAALEPVTGNDFSSAHPYFSEHDDRLYFSSNRPGGFGGNDIYYVEVYSEGTSEPVNCGESINTPGDEVYPFVLPDSMLYFSSDGHPGLGGLDIFSAKIDDDIFNEVRNLGAPVNSSRDDFSIVFNEDRSIGYFSSNRSGGVGDDDIYLVKKIIRPKMMEKRSEVVKVEVPDKQPVSNKLVGLETIGIGGAGINALAIPAGTASGVSSNIPLTIEAITALIESAKAGNGASDEDKLKNLRFRLYNIDFEFNSWEINSEAAKDLDKLADLMWKNKTMTIELSAHTDSRGDNMYNKALSQARADAALKYVLKKRISVNRIEAIGYGEQKLLNDCTDGVDCPEELHKENRRVEVLITGF